MSSTSRARWALGLCALTALCLAIAASWAWWATSSGDDNASATLGARALDLTLPTGHSLDFEPALVDHVTAVSWAGAAQAIVGPARVGGAAPRRLIAGGADASAHRCEGRVDDGALLRFQLAPRARDCALRARLSSVRSRIEISIAADAACPAQATLDFASPARVTAAPEGCPLRWDDGASPPAAQISEIFTVDGGRVRALVELEAGRSTSISLALASGRTQDAPVLRAVTLDGDGLRHAVAAPGAIRWSGHDVPVGPSGDVWLAPIARSITLERVDLPVKSEWLAATWRATDVDGIEPVDDPRGSPFRAQLLTALGAAFALVGMLVGVFGLRPSRS